jgi:hypothetical protein
VRYVVTETRGVAPSQPNSVLGYTVTRQWNVRASCTAGTCTANVTIVDGTSTGSLVLRRTATGWKGTSNYTDNCFDSNGTIVGTKPGSLEFTIDAGAGSTPPKQFTGRLLDRSAAAGICPTLRIVKKLTLTRTSGGSVS